MFSKWIEKLNFPLYGEPLGFAASSLWSKAHPVTLRGAHESGQLHSLLMKEHSGTNHVSNTCFLYNTNHFLLWIVMASWSWAFIVKKARVRFQYMLHSQPNAVKCVQTFCELENIIEMWAVSGIRCWEWSPFVPFCTTHLCSSQTVELTQFNVTSFQFIVNSTFLIIITILVIV